MNRERIPELWARFVAGPPLDGAEEDELREALKADPALRADFLRDSQTEGLLKAMGRSRQDGDEFARTFFDLLKAETDGTRFLREFEKRLDEARPEPPCSLKISTPRIAARRELRERLQRARRTPFWAAAGILAASLLIFAVVLSRSGKDVNGPSVGKSPIPKVESPEKNVVPVRPPEPVVPEEPPVILPKEEPKPPPEPLQPAPQPPPPEPEHVPDRPVMVQDSPKPPPVPKTSVPSLLSIIPWGEVTLLTPAGPVRVEAEKELASGEGVETAANGSAVLRFLDGTTVEVSPRTAIRSVLDAQGAGRQGVGTLLTLTSGGVTAQVNRRPAGQAFVLATPQAEAAVLGTRLRLDAADGKTQVEVMDGRVKFTRTSDRASVEVASGNMTTAAPGVKLTPTRVRRPLLLESTFEDAAGLNQWKKEVCRPDVITLSTSVRRNGKSSARFHFRKEDAVKYNYVRAELLQDCEPENERWYGFSLYFPSSYAADPMPESIVRCNGWPDFERGETWRAAPISIEIQNDRFNLYVVYSSAPVNTDKTATWIPPQDLGAVEKGKWIDWVFHVKFSYQSDGILEIWKNKQRVFSRYGPNSFNDVKYPYFKIGIAKWAWADPKSADASTVKERTLFLDEVRMGGKYSSVEQVSPR